MQDKTLKSEVIKAPVQIIREQVKYSFNDVTTEEINAIISAMDQVAHGAESADEDYVVFANNVQTLINGFLKKKFIKHSNEYLK